MVGFLAQASDPRVLCSATAPVTQATHAADLLRFVDLWTAPHGQPPPRLLVDSRLPTDPPGGRLHQPGIHGITLRRRGQAGLHP